MICQYVRHCRSSGELRLPLWLQDLLAWDLAKLKNTQQSPLFLYSSDSMTFRLLFWSFIKGSWQESSNKHFSSGWLTILVCKRYEETTTFNFPFTFLSGNIFGNWWEKNKWWNSDKHDIFHKSNKIANKIVWDFSRFLVTCGIERKILEDRVLNIY